MAARFSFKDLAQICAVVAIGWVVAILLRTTAPIGQDVGDNRNAQSILRDNTSPVLEGKDANLTMVVITDYQCPACKLANDPMHAAVAKDGHVRIVYKDWPVFGARSERAARVALASARQGIYPAVHNRLMANRKLLDDQAIREAIQASGGNWDRSMRDLANNREAIDDQIARNARDAFTLGVSGTPAYLIGPILVKGGLNETEFTRVFSRARKLRASSVAP